MARLCTFVMEKKPYVHYCFKNVITNEELTEYETASRPGVEFECPM